MVIVGAFVFVMGFVLWVGLVVVCDVFDCDVCIVLRHCCVMRACYAMYVLCVCICMCCELMRDCVCGLLVSVCGVCV